MSSKNKIWQQALVFLEREHAAFLRLRSALVHQAIALRSVDIDELELRQRELEQAIAETENTVYRRVKWHRDQLPMTQAFTWSTLWQQSPEPLDDEHQQMVVDLTSIGTEIKKRVHDNQRYAASAQDLLASLRDVQGRVSNEGTDLYTARGTLRNQVAMQATVGGVR